MSSLLHPSLVDPRPRRTRRSHRHSSGRASGLRWLRGCHSVGRNVRVTGPVLVRGRGAIVIGDDAVLDARDGQIELFATTGARLEIGPSTYVGPGASLEAEASVEIGAGAIVGRNAKVLDNNWHRTGGDRSVRPASAPVVIGAGARVGARATLLPGAALGAGSWLADDSVLSRRVPAGVLVAGVPAHLVRHLHPGEAVLGGPAARGNDDGPFALVSDTLEPVSAPMLRWLRAIQAFERMALPGLVHWGMLKAELGFAMVNAHHQLRGAEVAGRAYVHGGLDLRPAGQLLIGQGCSFAAGPARTRLEVAPGARLSLASGAIINYGVLIRARESIEIGAGCLMGSRTLVLDSHAGVTAPVTLGDDVWLAHGVTVLPGVTIGSGSAVSAGTVVDRDVPAGSLAVGAPMRFRPLTAVTGGTLGTGVG